MKRYFQLFILILLAACRPQASLDSSTALKKVRVTPLVFNLADDLSNLSSVEIKNKNSQVELISKDGIWFLAPPYNALISSPKLNWALARLIQAPQGQTVTLGEADYGPLLLHSTSEAKEGSSGIELILNFGDVSKRRHLILGAFEVPQNSEDAQMMGELAVARRYVRDIGQNKVYLTPAQLNLFEPYASLWQINKFPPIKRLSELTVTEEDGFSWKARKTSSYSPITFVGEFAHENVSRELISVFDAFFATGDYHRVLSEAINTTKPSYRIQAEDRFGASYSMNVYQELYDETEVLSDKLKKGKLTMDDGLSKDNRFRICRIEIDHPNARPRELEMISMIKDRYILALPAHFDLIEEVSAQLRKKHEKK